MAIAVVTRLRLRDLALLDEFFTTAVALLEQAKTSDGALGSDAMAEDNNVWWTVTMWRDRSAIDSYVSTDPHRSAIPRVDNWCDEATFVDWELDGDVLPDWQTGYQQIVANGTFARSRLCMMPRASVDWRFAMLTVKDHRASDEAGNREQSGNLAKDREGQAEGQRHEHNAQDEERLAEAQRPTACSHGLTRALPRLTERHYYTIALKGARRAGSGAPTGGCVIEEPDGHGT